MNSFLIKTGYILDVVTGIWSRQDYTGIAYSDGDEVEQRIASIINEASDLGVLSSELRQHCTDWPSLYHLSGTRANILRPFENDLHGDILEIGAGCGAITRYLGECGGNVLALEGSPRRAAIARARTRDLQNVTVVSDRFDLFSADQKFDAITLIGVLEYANLFTPGESPALNMLERVRALLKPEGKLFIAIENQLGLKYFAGAPEDHLGQPMYGIEGRYRNDQPQTFGRIILAEMLKEAGFSACDFLAPFPDYKLPVSVITERGFKTEKFDAAAFAWQSVHRDPQLPPILAFSPELVWATLAQNNLVLDLVNSFLIVASSNKEPNLESSALAWHFTTERKKEFCKTTQFVQTEADGIEVRYKSLAPALPRPVIGKLLKFDIPDRASYVYGIPLSQEFIRIVTRDGWRIEELCILLRKYLDIVANVACAKWQIEELSEPTIKLPGSTFDCIPQNIIISTDGGAYIIDKEWEATEPVQIGFLCFRSLITLFHNVTKFGHSADEFGKTYINLIQAVMNGLGWLPDKGMIISYVNLEAVIQTEVSGRVVTPKETMDWLDGPISKLNNLNQAVTEKDGQITSLSQAVTERDGQIEDLNLVIGEKDFLLKKIYGSKSWRITAPLRYLVRLLSAIRGAISNGTTIGAMPEAPQITNNQIESGRATDISNSNDQRHSDSAQRYRILLVSYYYPSRAHAGGLRILDIYALIKQRCPNVQLDLLTHHRPSIDGSIADSHRIFDNIYLSPVEDLSPSCFEGLTDIRYDLIDLQFHQAAYHLEGYKRIASKVIFSPMESLARVLYLEMQNQIKTSQRIRLRGLLAQFKFAYEEISFCRNADHVVCVSKTDAAFICAVGGGHKVCAIETGISPLEFAEALTNGFSQVSAKERPKKIIYVAYFGSQTNINALNWYLQKVHPRIVKAVPDYKLVVVGRGDLSSFEVYRGPQVELVGEVPLLTPYIKSAKIGIAPALGGSGFRGKVNQYAVLGIPAVVSPIALQGLAYRDGESVFVADDSSDFADRCIELLSEDDLNDRMAHEARKLCMKNYSWESKWPQISEVYGLQGNCAC